MDGGTKYVYIYNVNVMIYGTANQYKASYYKCAYQNNVKMKRNKIKAIASQKSSHNILYIHCILMVTKIQIGYIGLSQQSRD